MKTQVKKRILACILCIACIGCFTGQAGAEHESIQEPLETTSEKTIDSRDETDTGLTFSDGQANEIQILASTMTEEELPEDLEEPLPETEEIGIEVLEETVPETATLLSQRATGTDLAISNPRATNHTEPFPNMVDIPISVTIQNLGSTTISSFSYAVYLDAQNLTTKTVQVTLAPNTTATLKLNFKNRIGGTHTLLVDAWLPSGVTETNTANNTVSKDFQWADAVSVRAYAINGPSSVEPRVNHEYEVSVANLGNLDAVDIPVRFLLNGKDLGATARVSIPARKVLNFSVKAKFQNSGQASLGMSVDPQHTSADIDPDDNELSRTFQVLSFSNSFGGKWKNADGISVQILDKVKNLVDKEDFRLSMDGIVARIESWNDVADGVSFGDIEVSDTDEDLGMDIVLTTSAILGGVSGQTILGYAEAYDEDGKLLESNGSGQTDGYIGDWGDEIASAKVTLNSVGLLDFSSAVQAQTVIHEFGHALGLKHPSCSEPAVMQDNTNLAAYVILDHDVESLQAIYE